MSINIRSLKNEYLDYVEIATDKNNKIKWDKLVRLLCSEGEWTENGAYALVSLVQDYGSFVLKNALALALAADIEDGQLGI